MRIIAVDDEPAALEALDEAIRQAVPDALVHGFQLASAAISFAGQKQVDVAFLDINMPQTNGLALALALKEANPQVNIVFTTGYSQYAGDAFSMHASGFITKPVSADAVRVEMENLRYRAPVSRTERVFIQCFGSFAVFVNGKPLHFSRTKCKELLAYLVHKNGAGITSTGISAILWEDKTYDRSLRSQVQTVISQLMAILRDAGVQDIIQRSWNSIAIDKARVSCDFYDFLAGKPEAINAYVGEYLTDYSWAEFTAGQLMHRMERH